MSFHVYPDPPTRVRSVAPGATTEAIPVAEPASATSLVLRVAVVGSGCVPSTMPPPAVVLDGDGAQDEVTSQDGVDPTPVAGGRAFATTFRSGASGRGVFRVEIFKNSPDPIGWRVRFRNTDLVRELGLVWVFADNAAESRQPWIVVPRGELLIDSRPDRTQTLVLRVANLGTGPLTVTDGIGQPSAPGVSVPTPPAPVPPNGCGDVRLAFAGRADIGTVQARYRVPSNDTVAPADQDEGDDAAPTHNNQVRLRLTTHPPMPALAVGDVLVADTVASFDLSALPPVAGGLIRIAPATGRPDVVALHGAVAGIWAVAVETGGDLVFSGQDVVGRIIRASGAISILSSGGALSEVRCIAVARDGGILVPNVRTGGITRVDPSSGEQTQVWSGGTGPPGPFALAPDGTVVTVGAGSSLVRVKLTTGGSTVLFEKPGFTFEGLAVADDGVVYAAANHPGGEAHELIRFDPATGGQTVVFRADLWIRCVAVTAAGLVFVTARAKAPVLEGYLFRLDPGDGPAEDWPSQQVTRALFAPHGLAVLPPLAG